MKKSSRPVANVFGYGAKVVEPPQSKSGYDPDLWNTLKREEAEAQVAPIRRLENEITENLRAQVKRVKAFFSLPITELRSYPHATSPVDPGGEYEEGLRGVDAERKASSDFEDALEAQGVKLSKEGWLRFAIYLTCQALHRSIAATQDNLYRVMSRLHYDLDAFTPGEIVSGVIPRVSQPVEAAQPREETEVERQARIASEIEHGSDELHLVNLEMRREWQSMYRQFAEFMEKTYSVDVLSQRIVDFAVKWAEKWNKSLGDPRHLNELRRAMDYQMVFGGPRGRLLTADERTARALEDTPLTNASFETRQDIVLRLREMGKVE